MNRAGAALCWAAGLALCAALILSRGQLQTDLSLFLPSGANPVERLAAEQVRRGPHARVVLVLVHDAETAQLARLSKGLAGALEGSPHFDAIYNGAREGHQQLDTVFRYRYLLSTRLDQAEPFAAETLSDHFQRIYEVVSGTAPGAPVELLRRDPTNEFQRVAGALRPQGPERRQGVWFTADGQALLAARVAASTLDLEGQQQAVDALRTAFAGLPESTAATLTLTGPPVLALESRRIIKSEVRRLSVLATLAALGVLFLATRSWRFLVLGGIPLASAVAVGCAAVAAVFGGIHGITLAFGVTLVGVALDYPIHLFWHRRPGESGRRSARRIARPLLLGATTTGLGFAALCLSSFPGLAQLGVFAIAGVAAAALTTYLLLPPWLRGLPATPSLGLRLPLAPPRPAGWSGVTLVVLAIAAVYGAGGPQWVTELTRMGASPQELRELDRELRQGAGIVSARDLVVVQAADRQGALTATEGFTDTLDEWRRRGFIEGADPVTAWLASAKRQATRRERLPAAETLGERVAAATAGLPLRAAAFQPFLSDVAASRSLEPLRPDDLEGPLQALAGQRLTTHEGRWWSLVPLRGVSDRAALNAGTVERANVHYLDLKSQTEAMMGDYMAEARLHFALGAGVIALCLLLMLGPRRRALRVFLVAFGGVICTLAIHTALGLPMSLFSLVSLLLVAGLGLDYGLFVTEGDDRGQAVGSTGVCAASTVLAFALLATADIEVLADIGRCVSVGAAAAWLLAWLFASTDVPRADKTTA